MTEPLNPYPGNTNWPSNYEGCKVTGKYVFADGTVPPVGSPITFVLQAERVLDVGASTVVLTATITAKTDENGVLTDDDGNPYKIIPATDDSDVNPSNATYRVTEGFSGGRTFSMAAPAGTTIDLSAVQPVPSSEGDAIVRGPQGEPGDEGPPGPAGVVQAIVEGDNISVDSSDPARPRISADVSGGGVAVLDWDDALPASATAGNLVVRSRRYEFELFADTDAWTAGPEREPAAQMYAGASWTGGYPPTSAASVGGVTVVVAGPKAFATTDGSSFVQVASAYSAAAVASDGTQFVLIGTKDGVTYSLTSTDGSSWSPGPIGGVSVSTLDRIFWASNRFVAMTRKDVNPPQIAYSPDGRSWTARATPAALQSVAQDPTDGTYYAADSTGGLYSSSDLATWTAVAGWDKGAVQSVSSMWVAEWEWGSALVVTADAVYMYSAGSDPEKAAEAPPGIEFSEAFYIKILDDYDATLVLLVTDSAGGAGIVDYDWSTPTTPLDLYLRPSLAAPPAVTRAWYTNGYVLNQVQTDGTTERRILPVFVDVKGEVDRAQPAATGDVALVAGTATVADENVTDDSVIRLSSKSIAGQPGAVYVSAKTAGTGFTITSTSSTDTSTVHYEVLTY